MTDTTPAAIDALLKDVTPGPWSVDGPPWNQIIWSGAENRLAYMAHSNGLDDARDIATARFIAAARDLVPALAAERDAAIRERDDAMAFGHAAARAGKTRAEKAETEAAALRDEVARMREALSDPIAVHANMLRGAIAMPSVENIIHIYGAEALRAYEVGVNTDSQRDSKVVE